MDIVDEFLNDKNVTTVAIRVDASNRIGTGHVMRCLTLAKTIKVYGIKVIFLSKNHSGNLNHFIRKQGFELFALSEPKQQIENQTNDKLWLGCDYQDDVNECVDALSKTIIDMLIVDHYSLDYQWQRSIKARLKQSPLMKLMVIDDLANRKHDCDLLLDQTLGRKIRDYIQLVPTRCQLLLGNEYIMLRDEFIENRLLAKNKRKNTSEVKNIFISMGGTDPDNITEEILNWLIQFKKTNIKIQVTVVLNQISPFIENLKKISLSHNWINIITQSESIAKLMLASDIAIGSSGATAWERCCLGLPSLSIISAENQKFLNKNLSKAGAIINLGVFSELSYINFEASLNQLINITGNFQQMVERSFNCCDGLGVIKVTKALIAKMSHDIFLQKASYDDCQDIFHWQSNANIRKYFHNPKPVEWQQHCDWLKKTLDNNDKHLYMIKLVCPDKRLLPSIGFIRLDNIKDSQQKIDARWLISIIISPEEQGNKFAEKAIKALPTIYKEQGIIAEVHSNNIASHKLFSRAGFTAIYPLVYFLKQESLNIPLQPKKTLANYIVATIHPWNIDEFKHYSNKLSGHWHLITDKDKLNIETINRIKPDYIFFPHWSWIVPEDIFINWPCICFHMTDVPFGRGGSPLQNLIMRGIKKTKVSALQMTKQLDAGPVYLKQPLELNGSANEIFNKLALIVAQMISEIVTSTPIAVAQSGDIVNFERRTPDQSEIPKDLSAEKLYDFIRMLDAPSYPKAFIKQGSNKLEFSDAKLENGSLIAKVTLTTKSAKSLSHKNEKG